jgi:hypothetical protein
MRIIEAVLVRLCDARVMGSVHEVSVTAAPVGSTSGH